MPLKRRMDYSYAQRLEIIKDAKQTNISAAASQHNVDRKCIRRWMKDEVKLRQLDEARKFRRSGSLLTGITNQNVQDSQVEDDCQAPDAS